MVECGLETQFTLHGPQIETGDDMPPKYEIEEVMDSLAVISEILFRVSSAWNVTSASLADLRLCNP